MTGWNLPGPPEQCTDCGAWYAYGYLCREHRLCGTCHPPVDVGSAPVTVTGHVDLMRPASGLVRCAICFEARRADELLVDVRDGRSWDICRVGDCRVSAGLGADGVPFHV